MAAAEEEGKVAVVDAANEVVVDAADASIKVDDIDNATTDGEKPESEPIKDVSLAARISADYSVKTTDVLKADEHPESSSIKDAQEDLKIELPAEETSDVADLRRSFLDLRKIHDAALRTQESTLDELAALQKGHAFISAAKAAVDVELREERRKREAAEETVEMLRGQLEASRRALGTLKQQQQQDGGHDSPKVEQQQGLPPAPSLARTNKRQSLLFSRDPQHTDASASDVTSPKLSGSTTMPGSSGSSRVVSGGLRELRLGATPASPPPTQTSHHLETPNAESSRRWSAFPSFSGAGATAESSSSSAAGERPTLAKRSSQASSAGIDLGSPLRETSSLAAAVASSNSDAGGAASGIDVSTNLHAYEEELAALRFDVASLRGQLAESQEARIASENCLRALREFVATGRGGEDASMDGGGGGGGGTGGETIKLPPLPTDADADAELYGRTPTLPSSAATTNRPSGWRLGSFFKSPAAATPSSAISNNNASIASNVSDAGGDAGSLSSPSRTGVGLGLPFDNQQGGGGGPSTPLSSFVSNWTKGVPLGGGGGGPSTPEGQSTLPPPLPSRRTGSYTFGGLFNKSSSATNASSASRAPSLIEVDERDQQQQARATLADDEMERDENAERRRRGDEDANEAQVVTAKEAAEAEDDSANAPTPMPPAQVVADKD